MRNLGLVFLRIDDRLIHGQIVTTWMKEVNSNIIIIANDLLAKDSFMKRMIELAAPPGVKVEVRGVKDTTEVLGGERFEKDRVMVLAKTVEDVVGLHKHGLGFDYVNVGGMGAKAGTKVVYRNISCSDTQMELLHQLKAEGIEIEFKIVPNEKGMKI